jgi:hypothetical protein
MEITAKECSLYEGKIYKRLSPSFTLLILHVSYIILIKIHIIHTQTAELLKRFTLNMALMEVAVNTNTSRLNLT